MSLATIETDYLIVGSGAVGMAFADTLVAESDATLVIVDRHHGPGGHWNDAYPFVRLHQPSAYYGVNSRPLGANALEAFGINQGSYERASGAELLGYYEAVMQQLLATGRVQYFPMCHYLGEKDGVHQFQSLTSGQVRSVVARKKRVDTTYLQTAVPSTHPPKYSVAEGVKCVPLNDLPRIKTAHSGYVVVGSGKTGIDACLWLLENDVAPSAITWIMPRDAWYINRATVQPGQDFFLQSYGGFTTQLECVAGAKSLQDLLASLEATEQLLRLDKNITPRMYHAAIMSKSEMALLQGIQNIVRMGRVLRVEPNQIVLEQGSVPSDPQRLIVDCSASAVVRRPIIPVFNGNTITPQFVRTVQPTFSAAFIAHVEAHMADEAEKNKICTVVPLPDEPIDWLRMFGVNMANQYRWGKNKNLRPWIHASRLDGFSALADGVQEHEAEKIAVLERFAASAGDAMANIPKLLSGAPASA
jgi:NAD(P)-binding Rossmann-like domain